MNRIIIGNIVSLAAAALLALSCWTKNPRRGFAYQIIENIVLAVSSAVFGSWSAVVSMLLAALRMCIVLSGHYTRQTMILFCTALAILGGVCNTRGLMGLLPILATVEFAWANYRFTEIKAIKWSICANLILWDLYAFVIRDYASGITWLITLIITLLSLYRLSHAAKTE